MPLTDPRRLVPAGVRTEEFLLRPIRGADAARDFDAVVETRADLRVWEQSSWPDDDFTVEANRQDLEELDRRHLERRAFTYTVLAPDEDECLGCVYLFPISARFLERATVTPLVEGADWAEVDAVVYFWVRSSRVASDLDVRLLDGIRRWLDADWGLVHVVFVTSEQFRRQVDVLAGAGMRAMFALREPDKAGRYLVYADPPA